MRRSTPWLVAAALLVPACNGDGGEQDADAVTFRAVEPGPFDEAPTTVSPGEVTLRLVNDDQVAHSLRIEELDDGVDRVPGGDEGTATVMLEPDTAYTYYCDVPGHRDLGMEGSFETQA